MIFQHTIQAVLDGTKTQTRRLALPEPDGTGEYACEMICYPGGVMAVQRYTPGALHWTMRWQVGRTYAVQPARAKNAIARIRITDIRREDVRLISEADAQAEGFKTATEFFLTWCKMHDKRLLLPIIPNYDTGSIVWHGARNELMSRPAKHYAAWVLTFELVT